VKMTSSTETMSGTEKIAGIKEQYKKFIGRKILFILFSLILIFIIAGVAATLGSYPITVTEVYSIIWHGLFKNVETTKEIVVWNLRLPRILMGILAGIGLAIAGTMMQGILRNPLASPFTLGIASGAGFGAALAILLGAGIIAGGTGKYLIIGNAFVFSLIPTFVIIGLTRGTIGFIGLVAPHMCRMVIGGDNRFLIPASGFFGAALLLGADTIARTIMAPVILPVGVITAFMGGPLFLYLIMRKRREYW